MAEDKDNKPEVEPVVEAAPEKVQAEKKPEPVKEPERKGYTPNNCNF